MKFITLLFLACAVSLNGAQYYVDFVGGDNSNNGTSTSTPWKHCPGDVAVSGTPASVTLAAGDRINFRGGVTYLLGAGMISNLWSGGVGNHIVYDGTNWDGGAGMAIMNPTNNVFGRCFYTTAMRSNITFQGFVITNVGGYSDAHWSALPTNGITSPVSGNGIWFENGCQNIKVLGCRFERCGQWRNTKPFEGVNGTAGACMAFSESRGVYISDCDVTKSRVGISLKANTSDVTITNCEVHNYLTWGIDIAPTANGQIFSNILITRIRSHDMYEHTSSFWTGLGEAPHVDQIFARNSGRLSCVWTNLVVDRSLFYAVNPISEGTAAIFASEGASLTVQNCIFANADHARTISIGFANNNAYQYIRFYYNTIIGSSIPFDDGWPNTTLNEEHFLGNVLYRFTSNVNLPAFTASNTNAIREWDYNLYFSQVSSPMANWKLWFSSTASLFSVWTNSTDFYKAADRSSQVADPMFTSISGTADGWNLMPQTGSPLIAAGTNISAWAGFSTDFYGNPRPVGRWTVGAVEFQPSSPAQISIHGQFRVGTLIVVP